MGVLKEESLNILVGEINKNVNTKINAIKGSDKATDINMSDGTTVEVAVNKNKNDINDINTYLNKSENTKYQTVNGVKEFESKDGYVDNILVEGNTLANILSQQYTVARNIADIVPNTTVETVEKGIKVTFNSDLTTASGYCVFQVGNTDSFKKLKSSTTYTVIYDCKSNFKEINSGMYISKNDSTSKLTNPVSGAFFKNGKNAFTIQTIDNIPPLDVSDGGSFILALDINKSERTAGAYCQISNVMIVEGDYTQNPLGFFEVFASVGQGDKIEILSRKHGSNLYNNSVIYGKSIRESGVIVDNAEWCIIDSLYVEKNKTYTIEKGSSSGVSDNIGYIYVYEFNFDGSYSSKRHDLGLENNTFTPSKNCLVKISIKYTKVEGFGVFDSDLKLPYSTDKKQILATLRSLPNGVKDTVEKRGNKYYSIQRIIEVDVYDAIKKYNLEVVIEKENETTSKPIIKNFVTTLGGKVNGNNFNVHCSHFKVANIYQDTITEEGMYLTTHMHNRILKSKVVGLQGTVSKNAMLAWYRTNKVKVVFELAEPIITELPNLNLRTFSPQTTLFVDSGIVQADISFDVTNTLGSSIDAMADKIGSLEDMLGGQLEIGTERINNLLRKING